MVDDGSIDQTFFLAQSQGIKALKHIINRGQGAALETGNQYALLLGAEIIVHFDADGQYLAEEIKNCFHHSFYLMIFNRNIFII